ncbi:MAG: DUF4364 family protein [Eubacteriales bacterium]
MLFDSENILENKLIILYALSHFKSPLTKEQMTQIILENIQISYFDIYFLIDSLKEDDFIIEVIENDQEFYTISEKGSASLSLFTNRIPLYIKEIIDMFIQQNKDKILKHVRYIATYLKQGDEDFVVNLKIIENDVKLLDIYLNVVNKKQAEFVCDNWKKNGNSLYVNILNILVNPI